MSQVVLYIAISLDGFIARQDGKLDWLTSVPNPETGDYGYSDLLNSIGTTIMGRKTYDEVLGFGGEWHYAGKDSYIVTNQPDMPIKTPDTYRLTENVIDFVADLKQKAEKDIWLVGGGQLVTMFINYGLLDKMILTIVPKLIGDGIPLFAPRPTETNWQLLNVETFDTGIVNLTYEKPQ